MPKLPGRRRKENPEAIMSIGDHLRELRNRLFISAIGITVMAVVGYFLSDKAYQFITYPVEAANAEGANLNVNFSTLLSSFDMRMRISIWIGVLLSSPLWIYEFFAYVGPGMTRKEKAYTWVFGVVGLLLFAAGCALGIWVMPRAVRILTSFIPHSTSAAGIMDVSTYLSFMLRLVLAFGIAFLLPEVMVALNRLGVMKGRTMLKGWRWAVVGIFTFMAFANPLPDPWSMIFMAIPITGLYFLACYISIRHDKHVAKRRAEEDAALDAALAENSSVTTV
ncbi:twin-arginine translocase subunit TatC [Actinomyces ruminis]